MEDLGKDIIKVLNEVLNHAEEVKKKIQINSLIVDNFLNTPNVILDHAHRQLFDGVKNPLDGVVYPDVTVDIPSDVTNEILGRLNDIFTGIQSPRSKVKNPTMFIRRSIKGVPVPHQAHTDVIMGTHTLLLYLNKEHPNNHGTEVLEHSSGEMDTQPTTEEQVKLWEKDTNTPEAWNVVSFCKGTFNRAFIIKSDLFHRAQPVGGFGSDNYDGRLVLTCFFDVED